MIRTYSRTRSPSVKLSPTDPHPSLVMINPHIPGLEAVRQDGRSRASTLWKVVVGEKEDQYQSAVRIAPGGPDVVYDLDGDGRYELLAVDHQRARRPASSTSSSSTPRPASALAEAGDERVLSVDDLDGDGQPEVLLQAAARCGWRAGTASGFIELWRGDGVEPLVRPLPSEGDLSRTSGGNTPVWRESPGSDLFLLRFPDGVSACRLAGSQVVRVKPVADARGARERRGRILRPSG